MCGLPHAVVKQAENLQIDSHPHREAFQADLQQNNACNAFSDESLAMIRELGNVELLELCGTCILYWNQGIVHCTCGYLLKESEATLSRRGDLEVLGTAKLRHRKSISLPTTRGRDVCKRNLKEFTIASNEIQHIVTRNSKFAGLRRSASRWINWHRKTFLLPIL